MELFKTVIDVATKARSFLELVAGLYEQYPLMTVGTISLFLLLLMVQARATLRELFHWVATGKRMAVLLTLGLFVLVAVGVAWASAELAAYIAGPRPMLVKPEAQLAVFGQRVVFSWEMPEGHTDRAEYQIQISQGEAINPFESSIPRFALRWREPRTLKEGEFRWRVRSRNPKSNWSIWRTNSIYRDHVSRILGTGKVRVGLFSEDLRPYTYTGSSATNEVKGIEVDVARLVVEELSEKLKTRTPLGVEFIRNEWLIGNTEDIRAGVVDVVFANTTRSDDREAKYGIRFSEPYYHAHLGIAWMQTDYDQAFRTGVLQGRRIIAWEDSTPHQIASALGAEVVVGKSTAQMLDALDNREVDGIVDDARVLDCEFKDYEAGTYRLARISRVIEDAIGSTYPEPISAFVSRDVSASELLGHLDEILSEGRVFRSIQRMIERRACQDASTQWD